MIATTAIAKEKDYPLLLEVKGYGSVANGYYTSPRSYNAIGNTTLSSGGATYALTTMTSTAILNTPTGKMRCTLWNRKHYLTVDMYRARQIAADQLEVVVPMKKGKVVAWKFKIIGVEKIE
jgi:hypothetical protein